MTGKRIHKPVITIHGCLIIVKRGPKQLLRRLVSPEWLRLYICIKKGEFDESLWISLPRELKSLMGYVARIFEIPFSDEFNVALATDYKADYDRLKLLEGSIRAGNNNKALIDECIDIIDGLAKSGQLQPQTASLMKASFRNSSLPRHT